MLDTRGQHAMHISLDSYKLRLTAFITTTKKR